MAAAADGEQKVVLARCADAERDVGHAFAAGHKGGAAIDIGVPDRAGGVVVAVARREEAPAETRRQLLARGRYCGAPWQQE